VYLLAPKERQFDPFGKSLRSKLRRLMTRDDGLDNPRRQERQPSQAPDVVWEHPFTPGERCNRFHLTAQQIVSPLASPRDGFDEGEISQWSGRATALENQTHFEPAPPDLHREDTRDSQFCGTPTVLLFRDGVRELEGTRECRY
jgi:hypothetical protein